MPENNMSGSFGSNRNRQNIQQNNYSPNRQRNRIRSITDRIDFNSISPERWVDIICISFIVLFLIIVICSWPAFSAVLFAKVLFPIINVGSKIVALVTAIGTGIGILYAKIRRRRYWW